MPVFDIGVSRNQYKVRVDCSILYEIALDVAAFTWDDVHDKLDKGHQALSDMRGRMTQELKQEVALAGRVHTWRSLLFLVHRCPALTEAPLEAHVRIFTDWLLEIGEDVITYAAPHLTSEHQEPLWDALRGSRSAQAAVLEAYNGHPLIYNNLQHLFATTPSDVANHIHRLVTGWYKEMVDDVHSVMETLRHSRDDTNRLAAVTGADELIRTLTKGGEFRPEPGYSTLWLIPQIAYRPFTIVNSVMDSSVYYYPVSENHLPGMGEQALISKIAAIHKAVGDVHRVRLLKLLRTSAKSLADLAIGIDASKSSTHHHLLLLRSVGLVQVEAGVYSLRKDVIAKLGDELMEFLQIGMDGGL